MRSPGQPMRADDVHQLAEAQDVAVERLSGIVALPESKGGVQWLDADCVLVGTDFGAGSLTSAGYLRTIRRWRPRRRRATSPAA